MKRTLTLFACVAICCAMAVSCKNAKTTEPTKEEIQAQKVALADSVLAQIDAFADEYVLLSENDFRFPDFGMTEEEKMVKPDYLLEPSFANTLVTKSQKVNALAFYLADIQVRKLYDMPMEETKEVIVKLAVELNHPVTFDDIVNIPRAERFRKEYFICKENGDLAYFWQLQNALGIETSYIIAQNPELFFSKITEEQWQAFVKRINEKNKAMRELAKYDEEMADVLEVFNQNRVLPSDEEKAKINASMELVKQFRIDNKDKFIARRNALLQ